MKNQIHTAICTILLFVPWTIFPLRTNRWALESPAAEIIIACYCILMIGCGILTGFLYYKAKAKTNWIRLCLLVNGLYAAAGVVLLGMLLQTQFM